MNTIETFKAARETYAALAASLKAVRATVELAFPTPGDEASDEAFELWCDESDAASIAAGEGDLLSATRAAAFPMIRALREQLLEQLGSIGIASVAFEGALGENRCVNMNAHRKMIALCLRAK